MLEENVHKIPKLHYVLLPLVIALAFYLAFIPHQGYAYPVHLDEWLQMGFSNEIISEGRIFGLTDPFTGQGTHGNQIFEIGSHLFWAIFHQISGISWLTIFKYFPAIISGITVLLVYVMAQRKGFGLEAAFFTCLITTTVGLLGPGFLVPVAMGLPFIVLAIFLAFNFKTVWSYISLLAVTGFLVSLHPPTAINLVLILIPYILLGLKSDFKHSLILGAVVAAPFLLPFPWIIDQLLPTAKSMLTQRFAPNHVDIPRMLALYGYLPILMCLLGTFTLALKGGRKNYGLILGLLALLIMLAVFYTLHYGQYFVYIRGLTVMMLMIGIVAGAGLMWVRKLRLLDVIVSRWKVPPILQNFGYILCVIVVGLTLYIAIPVRQNIPYYYWIDQEDYEAFVWIKGNLDDRYDLAILAPHKGIPFTAITGKIAYARVTGLPSANSGKANSFLGNSCNDTTLMEDNGISIVYTQGECNNPDLVEVRDNVYLLKEAIPPN